MPYLTKYHIREQEAYALLGPIVASLRELEQRTEHYANRLNMEPRELETVAAAQQAIAEARANVQRLWQDSQHTGRQ
jgi:hypothetical protein